MRLRLADSGPPVEVPAFLGATLLVDLVVGVGIAAAGPFLPLEAPQGWAVSAYGAALVVVDLFAARLSPKGLAWRRRLGYVAMIAVVWRNGPLSHPLVAVAVVAYMGLVWIALVVGGRALSRAIASATGEDRPE